MSAGGPPAGAGPEGRPAGSVGAHYGRDDLLERLFAALRAAGKDPENVTATDLVPLDQFHTRGMEATLELARLAGVTPGMRVLDAGGGLGGPACALASEFGCSVEVLDLTEEFCRAGEALTARTGLAHRVSFRHGSALEMPYADASYDLVWTQHSSMNIADKGRLYAEIERVLRPGGRLALHEVMAGSASPIHLPVPWARDPRISHLEPPEKVRTLITATGLRELAWTDETANAVRWLGRRAGRSRRDPPPGPHPLFGPDFREMADNHARNLREGRTSIFYGLFEKPRGPALVENHSR